MSEKIVLVIDDSSTIRRLVDKELSSAGYRMLLAATAEDGVESAQREKPDLIILDHQLPGTTGYEVCQQLLADPDTASIPIVASSTLRKKAYSEYLDCDNVVDMLPKPYSPEVLIATVQNAIETAAMVVQSQNNGSAVPEVINETGDSDLCGTFDCFSLREIVDLVNNASKTGTLEVNTNDFRAFVFTDNGRIQAVTASGIDPELITRHIPENLSDLAPVVKLTVTGKRGSEVDGMVELLNNKVLDPRLLQRLLRIQAATLLSMCFSGQATTFRFDRSLTVPPLFQKLPLNSSLLALLVEGAMHCDHSELPQFEADTGFVRQSIRGQSLDRAGLSSRHMQLMKILAQPVSSKQISEQLGWSEDETNRVLHGFETAGLVQRASLVSRKIVYCVSKDTLFRNNFSRFAKDSNDFRFQSVSDLTALGLLVRRQKPDAVLIDVADQSNAEQFKLLRNNRAEAFEDATLVALFDEAQPFEERLLAECGFDFAISQTTNASQIINRILRPETKEQTDPSHEEYTAVC